VSDSTLADAERLLPEIVKLAERAAAVILAAAIVEGQAREKGAWRRAETARPRDREAVWLHHLRNRLLHEDKARPVLTVDAQWFPRDHWEEQATRAVELAFAALYGGDAGSGEAAP